MHPQIIKTDAQIRALKAPEAGRVDVSVANVPGLRVRVTHAGTKTFRLESRKTGKITLGTFPGLSLAEARSAALALLSDADRAKVNRKASAPVLAKKTRAKISDVLDQYEREASDRQSGWPAERAAIEGRYSDLLPRYVDSVTEDMVLAPVLRDRNVAAKRAASYLSKVLRWHGGGSPVPTRRLADLVREKPRDRVLTRAEIKAIWNVEDDWQSYIRALMLTMQRRGDVAGMMWSDLDLMTGIWSAKIHKNRGGAVRMVMPLSDRMREIIKQSKGQLFIFETRTGQPLRHNHDRKLKTIQEATKTSGWTWHDLRRTSRTIMSAEGVAPHIAERCMAHTSPDGKIAAIYDRYDWLEQMREAFEALSARLVEIGEG